MSIRSKLFATVAMPVLAASMVVHPVMAKNLAASFDVAQAEEAPQGEGQSNEEELLRLKQQQAEEAARAAAEQQAAEQQAAQEAEQQRQLQEQQAAEQKAAEDAAAAAAAAERQAAEQKAAEDAAAAAAAQQAAEQKAAEDAAAAEQQAAEQKAAEDAAAASAAEQKAAEDAAAAAAAEQQATEQKAADDAAATAAAEKQAAEQKAAEDAAAAATAAGKQATDQKATDDAAAAAEQQRLADEQKAAEQKAAEDAQKAQEQQAAPAEEQPATAEQPATTEQPAVDGQQPVTEGQPATAEQPQTDPAVEQPQQTTETPAQPVVVPEIVDTTTPEQKQEIAADPAKTDDTIVLPIEGGAAVLDSDKDADNAGGQTARDERKKLRESQRAEQEAVVAPTNDADAQAKITKVESEAIQAGITEEGQKLDAAPVFVTPGVINVENNTVNNNVTSNTVNNTITNNNVTNNVTNVVVQQQIDNRTVLSVDNQIIIRNDDRPRLRRDSEESFYEELSRGRVRETIVRPNGSRLVTVYDRYGDIIQRSRINRDGEEYLMVYAPEPEADRPPRIRDIGYELPPMRLSIPVRDYIIDTSSEPDRDYYDFLAEPPVERVERVYSIDEVKYSARLRDKVRRIDLDTITFATGSSEVPLAQAKTLRKVANAISEVLQKDQGETFLIEGHTDAVGKDQPNLVLSDQRAEAVAELLTDVYGIPPENLVTQGYGERFLKVKTQVAEQQNRRVTIRRVTPLVRPVAQK
ncbi:OmpA family protein [Pararhizobium sp. PWRC1-1]|uniref:OmpA family protein n=1 Tax=Pararhizobium sp. PWRC1-1 TaxID=2804566 RepID=UPI003CEF64FA